ncbi:MAG TPA: CpXC domain-containing protein [Candidatus Acutalibacter pullicola]|uniref:CpXC domain-containing protein n=1 Tax=Candidatus Acutalibacter pullicola TaxID=2838417 RepID=A0A9D2SF45_9FIRM|nr:CpXC domain-containing protein [Candidatus Acutalibacter pullicola]
MSTEISKDIICPQCGESQKYRLFASINAKENPELKRRVLDETLFDWRCTRCNYFAAMAYSFLYTDPDAGYIICVTPAGEGSVTEPTQEIQDFTKRSVRNLAELKEKILIFDAGFDDVAVELVKNALCTIIRKTYQVDRVHGYFSRVNNGEMEFAIFLPRKYEPVYHSTKLEVYRQSQEVLRSLDFVDPQGFAKVDSRLARKILEEYQNI